MTNQPPGGDATPEPEQDPGQSNYEPPPGSGYEPPPGPGYSGPPPGPGYGPPHGRGYGPPPGPGYGPPPGPGYGPPPGPSAPGPGYPPPQDQAYGQEQARYYEAPPGPGYAMEPAQQYDAMQVQDYPVQVFIEYPEHSSRLLAGLSIPYFLTRMIMLIPALFVIYFVGIAAGVVAWISFWAVLFTGRYPRGFHEFVAGYLRWSTRISAYLLGMTDKYPPFRLSP